MTTQSLTAQFLRWLSSGTSVETWDEATGAELAVATIETDTGSGTVAVDSINAVYFADLNEGVIAMASVWYNRFTRKIVECDIQFNTDFPWGRRRWRRISNGPAEHSHSPAGALLQLGRHIRLDKELLDHVRLLL